MLRHLVWIGCFVGSVVLIHLNFTVWRKRITQPMTRVSCSQEFLGCHLLDQEVGRPTCVAISSGETEFHAFVFTKNLVDGFGFPLVEVPIVHSDSSAGRGFADRKGVGKLKHLQVRSLWLQQARVDGQVKTGSTRC